MIQSMIREELQLVRQQGDVVNFKRRSPAESQIAGLNSLPSLYDFIRMLDADGYPPAFLRCAAPAAGGVGCESAEAFEVVRSVR